MEQIIINGLVKNVITFVARWRGAILPCAANFRRFAGCLALSVFGLCFQARAGQVLLTPSLSLEQVFTDNLYLTDQDKKSEWITTITPKLDFLIKDKSGELSLVYAPGFSLYADHSEYDSFRHDLSLAVNRELGAHWKLTFTDHYNYTEEPYDQSGVTFSSEESVQEAIDYTIRKDREPHSSNDAGLGLTYQFGPKDLMRFSYGYGRTWDENPGAEDSVSQRAGYGVDYWFIPHWGISLQADYSRGEFSKDTDTFDQWSGSLSLQHEFDRFLTGFVKYSHSYIDYKGPTQDYQVYSPSLGLTYNFVEQGYITVEAGHYWQDKESLDQADQQAANQTNEEKGWNVALDINKTWSLKRGQFRLSGGSGYDETYFGAENLGFTIYYGGGVDFLYFLSKHLAFEANGNYRHNRYTDQDPERRDHVTNVSSGLAYWPLKWLMLALKDQYRVVESNQNENDYRENRVVFTLSLVPEPMRLN